MGIGGKSLAPVPLKDSMDPRPLSVADVTLCHHLPLLLSVVVLRATFLSKTCLFMFAY